MATGMTHGVTPGRSRTSRSWRGLGPEAFCALVLLLSLAACGEDVPGTTLSGEHVYEYGTPVSFGYGGDSYRFRTTGWSQEEKDFTWTEGPAASLVFRAPYHTRPMTLHLRLEGLIKPPELPYQPVEVFVNGNKLLEWHVAGEAFYSVDIPAGCVPPGPGVVVDLRIPRATSPASLGLAADARQLGVRCFEAKVVTADPAPAPGAPASSRAAYAYGTLLEFGQGQNGLPYLAGGWGDPEQRYVWSTDVAGALELPVPPTDRPLRVRATLAGLVKPPLLPSQEVTVLANGQPVAQWSVVNTGEFTAVIPAGIPGVGGTLRLELRTPLAATPKSLGLNGDLRRLGISLFHLAVTPESP